MIRKPHVPFHVDYEHCSTILAGYPCFSSVPSRNNQDGVAYLKGYHERFLLTNKLGEDHSAIALCPSSDGPKMQMNKERLEKWTRGRKKFSFQKLYLLFCILEHQTIGKVQQLSTYVVLNVTTPSSARYRTERQESCNPCRMHKQFSTCVRGISTFWILHTVPNSDI